jgi:glycosyltransferase involved in cell wall biosynthesis
MVKVANLVADTIWSPGAGYNDKSPEISIFLPTFRRAADGLLQKVLQSIATQSFRDFELIVIDDASTDGSADIVRDWMARDPRISCLTHPRNVGLPAVSEFEAYLKSRGRFIGFAFDDFVYEPGAFEALIKAARANPEALVHGYAEMVGWSGPHQVLGRSGVPAARLWHDNFIANATVFMPRQIIEAIGFYDPHIMAARNCDWDLWRRAQRHYPFVSVPVFIGREHGTQRADSLGRTYPVFQEVMFEFYGSRSNDLLLPKNLPERDVWTVPTPSSFAMAAAAMSTRKFFRNKAWASLEIVADTAELQRLIEPKRPIIGVAGSLEATISLCFDGVRDRFAANLRFVDFQALASVQAQHVLLCDAVIVSRGLLDPNAERVISLCTNTGIDLYYLADDNPILIAMENPELSRYRLENVRAVLKPFKGVLATSPRLVDYYRANDLHPNVQLFGPILDQATLGKMRRIAAEPHPEQLRVGFIGGKFRESDLRDRVFPALQELSHRIEIEFFARGSEGLRRDPPPSPLGWRPIPFAMSYDDFLQRWRALGIDILIHPKGQTLNIDYKTHSILLTALYLGAVPIVCDESAFRDIGENEGILKVSDGPGGFAVALERASNPDFRQEMLRRLEAFCRRTFDPAVNEQALQKISDATRPTDLIGYFERLSRECARLSHLASEANSQFNSRAFKLALKVRHVASWLRRARSLLRSRP